MNGSTMSNKGFDVAFLQHCLVLLRKPWQTLVESLGSVEPQLKITGLSSCPSKKVKRFCWANA